MPSQPEQLVYRHIWRIADDTRPLSALRAEAAAAVDVLAALAGARLTGQPTITVAGDRLVLEAPAVRLPADHRPDVESAVTRLVWVRWPDWQIGDALGLPVGRVREIRQARSLPEAVETVEQTEAA